MLRDSTDQEATISKPRPLLPSPARFSVNWTGLRSRNKSTGPSQPDLSSTSQRSLPVSNRTMKANRALVPIKQANWGISELHPIAHATKNMMSANQQYDRLHSKVGMATKDGFQTTVESMFGKSTTTTNLVKKLLEHFEPSESEATAFLTPLIFATALHSLRPTAHVNPSILLNQFRKGLSSPALFGLERILASTQPGTDAIRHLRNLGLEAINSHRDGLLICSALESKGFELQDHSSIEEVIDIIDSSSTKYRLSSKIGSADDVPLQLLAQALKHTHGRASGADPVAHHKAAFVAWKKGGFVESGPGTDFNKAIERLHKFSTYVDRANHGSRSFVNIASDTVALFNRMLGKCKSPLTQTRHGTLGGDLGLLHQEVAKFNLRLAQTIDIAVKHFKDELSDKVSTARHPPEDMYKSLARVAVLDLCKPETDWSKILIDDIVLNAKNSLVSNGKLASELNENMLLKHVRSFTKRNYFTSAPTVRIGLSALATVGAAQVSSTDERARLLADVERVQNEIKILRLQFPPLTDGQKTKLVELQEQRRQQFTDLVADIRQIRKGGESSIQLVKWSDFKLLLNRQPREGPSIEDAQRTMHNLSSAKYESMAKFSDGFSTGIGTLGVFPLNIGALGVPLVYPVLSRDYGKRATISVGITNTGGRLFVGTEKSISSAVGVGAGWVVPTPPQLSAALVGDLSFKNDLTHSEGVVITARNDMAGWSEKLPQVVDFMFQQSRLPQIQGRDQDQGARAVNASETWARFANRFGDDPHIAVGWTQDKSAVTSGGATITGAIRITNKTGTGTGPSVTVSLRTEDSQFHRTPLANGTDVPIAMLNRSLTARASFAIANTNPGVPTSNAAVPAWGSSSPLVGVTMQWDVAGGQGEARLGRTRDGQLSAALCHREFIFRSPQRLIEFAELRRKGWTDAMMLSNNTTLDDAKIRLDTFLGQVAATPANGDRLHGESMVLKQSAAEKINHYEAHLTTILGTGNEQASVRELTPTEIKRCDDIHNEVQRLLTADESWQHNALFSVESNQIGSSTGLNIGIRLTNQEQASAARLTALLIASKEDV